MKHGGSRERRTSRARGASCGRKAPQREFSGARRAPPNLGRTGKRSFAQTSRARSPSKRRLRGPKKERPRHTLPRYRCSLSGLAGFTFPSQRGHMGMAAGDWIAEGSRGRKRYSARCCRDCNHPYISLFYRSRPFGRSSGLEAKGIEPHGIRSHKLDRAWLGGRSCERVVVLVCLPSRL